MIGPSVFLIVDLPDANNVGTLSSDLQRGQSFFDAKAVPQAGFWLELVGALALALTGTALATLTPISSRLRLAGPRLGGPRRRGHAEAGRRGEPASGSSPEPAEAGAPASLPERGAAGSRTRATR